jgi:rhomboid protease GluP
MEGEWWRLASATLLHGGLMHVAFNGYVLFSLGNFVERLLGPSRFLLLYVVSGVAASCGSLLLNAGVSVGASGAIWGLLGAEAALAFAPNQLLPSSMRKDAQRATVVNLVLNTLVSFLPRVDWAAHFAGGAAGALVLLSGVVLSRTARSVPADSLGWRTLGGVLGAVFFATALYGVLQPWLT